MCHAKVTSRGLGHALWLGALGLGLGASLLGPGSGGTAEPEPAGLRYSVSPAQRDECRRRLGRIYEAILEYQKEYQTLPPWLSDMVPKFISDAEVLVCPYVRNSGSMKKWREALVVVPVFADPLDCTYAYEFCQRALPELPDVTCRGYKQKQMALVGFGVPIVRCLAHRPVLNLAFDGSLYESDVFWEDNFVRGPDDQAVLHDILLTLGRAGRPPVAGMIRPREPKANARLIDLTKHYTATLLHLSQIDLAGKLLPTFPEGVTNIGGVQYDVRGLVHLAARDFPVAFPERVDGIAVARKCVRFHFLQGAALSAAPGTKIASWLVRYQDGRTNEVPVVYGRDLLTRWSEAGPGPELEKAKPVWMSPPELAGPRGRSLRLYHTAWNNPLPDLEVKELQFVSHLTAAAPFLVALTVE